jgi:hypothetical protein
VCFREIGRFEAKKATGKLALPAHAFFARCKKKGLDSIANNDGGYERERERERKKKH